MNGVDAIGDVTGNRCEAAFDRAESLLDEGRLAEALRVLQGNEVELRGLVGAAREAARSVGKHQIVPPVGLDAPVAVPEGADYPGITVESTRLPVLLSRAGSLLNRCEAMRDGTAQELRLLRTSRRFQSGSSVAGTWFSQEV